MTEESKGLLYALGAYILWGLFPLYWKYLDHVQSSEILASRIIWAFVTTFLALLIIGQFKHIIADLKSLWRNKKQFFMLLAASVLISVNWFTFIWAVNSDHIVETSLGYYINPLVSVLLGIFFLNERLSRAQMAAFLIAAIGVLIMAISYGRFPWMAFLLAFTFAFYGLLKKSIKLDSLRGLTIETLFITPLALIFYIYLFQKGEANFLHINWQTDLLLILSGAATALPLLLFANGAKRIPLYMVGFLQYIAPTMMLIFGVFVYNETFGIIELFSFSLIWASLILFTWTKIAENRKRSIVEKLS